jgi:hypothetical protein
MSTIRTKKLSDVLRSRAKQAKSLGSVSKVDPRIYEILEKNKKKDFVKRILRPGDYPTLDMGKDAEGNAVYASHIMAWGEHGGKAYVYPTVIHKKGKLHRISGSNALRYAIQTGENIEFDDPKEADWFSKNYKQVWHK